MRLASGTHSPDRARGILQLVYIFPRTMASCDRVSCARDSQLGRLLLNRASILNPL